ncbi:MAG TPA: hypothetical protein VM260_19135, partial [Pirellula sp.]|nr:hypothetical protein [Pirellula sp.]
MNLKGNVSSRGRHFSFTLLLLSWLSILPACRKEVATNSSEPRASGSTPSHVTPLTASNTRFRFEDQTQALGIAFQYCNGEDAGLFSIVESLGGGVGIFDFDGDGMLDTVATGGGKFDTNKSTIGLPNGLFRNQ